MNDDNVDGSPGEGADAGADAPARTKVMLVDDHPLMRDGVRRMIETQDDLEVCGEAGDAEGAMSRLAASAPDVVVLDISLGDDNGITLIRRMHAQRPELAVLALSMHHEALYAEHALNAGACGYVSKRDDPSAVLRAIRIVAEGGTFISESMGAAVLRRRVGGPTGGGDRAAKPLSPREFEILHLIGTGLTASEIAARLQISVKTVNAHRQHIKQKLGLNRAMQLDQYAARWVNEQQAEPPP
jgi:DNA-binding NarL/FixJ family response regulator